MKDNKERQLAYESLNRETSKYFFIGFLIGISPFILFSLIFPTIKTFALLIGLILAFINAYYMLYQYREKCKGIINVKKETS